MKEQLKNKWGGITEEAIDLCKEFGLPNGCKERGATCHSASPPDQPQEGDAGAE